jgi:hypothetical protein
VGPISHSDGHEAPWLASEFVPGLAAVIEQIVSVEEDPVGQPVVAHELPDVLGRVELGTFGRKGHEREITRHIELAGHVPSRLIEKQDGMASRRDILGDFIQMQLHRFGVALWQDQADRLALFRTDRAEDIGRGGALVARR